MKIKIIIILLFGALMMPNLSWSQNVNTEFGKNRVQYHGFEWWQYETSNFIVYWYKESRNVGQSVVQMAELDHEEIRSLMEYRISDKIEILVYTDLTDLKQSNIGKDQVFVNTGGQTTIVDNKMFVYFNGDHNQLREQIRQGIARIYLNYMMYGGNIQEIVQNAVLLNLPNWFTEGLVSYVGNDWDTELDNKLRDGILSGDYGSFEDLIEVDPRLAGHSFWYFIAQNYGKATVSNLLYLTRINRSVENGFLYVLGTSFFRVSKSWYNFFQQHYNEDANVGNALDATQKVAIKNKRNIPLNQIRLSPNGQQVAYISNEIGKKRVYIQDVDGKNRKVILKNGFKNIFQATDYNYPLLAWSPNGAVLAVIYEKRDEIKILLYNTSGEKSETLDMPTVYQRILSLDWVDNRQMVFSAIQEGYSDIYLLDTRTRQSKPITRDYHDDVDVAFAKINGRRGILFSSNRPDSLLVKGVPLDSLLPLNTYDLYFYDIDIKNNTELVRLTNTPFADEKSPRPVNDRYFTFTSNEAGVYNRSMGYIDTVFAFQERVYVLKDGEEIKLPKDSILTTLPEDGIDTTFIRDVYKPKGFSYHNTNYNRNILEQHTAPRSNKVASLFLNNGEYQLYVDDIEIETKTNPAVTHYMRNKMKIVPSSKPSEPKKDEPKEEAPKVKESPKDTIPPQTEKVDSNKIDIDNYFFQSEFEDEEPKPTKPVEPIKAEVEVDKNKGVKVQNPTQVEPENKSPIDFRRSKITPYRLQFTSDFVSTQLDNSMLFGGLNPTVDNQPDGLFPPLGLMGMVNVEDLFEDYRLRLGVRVPVTFNGVEYFAIFDDESKRLDKRYNFYRSQYSRSQEIDIGGSQSKLFPYDLISNVAQVQLRYPLDIYQSFRGTITGRIDNRVYEAEDDLSLELDNVTAQRLGLKLEYVFDNTLDVDVNFLHGTRIKATAEVMNKFSVSLLDSAHFEPSTGLLGLVGIDARHYQKLDKHSIFAARFAAYSSFGSNKILYFLGGTSNWLGAPAANDEIPVPTSDEFVYQGAATNLRGFRNNIRNGNSYALLNLELRVPITKYITRRSISNSFIRNLQFNLFFDTGTAWEGFSPFRDDNPLNTVVIEQPNSPLRIKVNYFRNPIVMGYGFGFRSMLLGYFVRFDYAWGVETGIVNDPRLYLSLGTDF